MMTLPSSSQLLSVIRAELAETLTGLSDDPRVINCLGMVDSMLATIAVRCDHEIGWMVSEIAEIEQVAEHLIAAGHDPDGRIANGLQHLRGRDRTDFQTACVRADYHLASTVLADCTEVAVTVGGEPRRRIEAVLATRLEHEQQIRGALELVGRG
jgi:hypothetical protein